MKPSRTRRNVDDDRRNTIRAATTIVLCALATLGLAACGSGGNGGGGPSGPMVTVEGQVRVLPESSTQTAPLPSAEVRAHVDRNGNGSIDSDERVTTEPDNDGNYSLDIPAEEGQTIVLRITDFGYTSIFESIDVGSSGTLQVDATLQPLASLDCTRRTCSTQDGSLSLSDLPEGFTGSGETFNPATNPDVFPGDFSDDQGNLLQSGVFAEMNLRDENGDPANSLEDPATMRMRIPNDTWSVIRDIDEGNGQIDVPLYDFGSASGDWQRGGDCILVDENGEALAESLLQQIRDGNYEGVVFSQCEVTSASGWKNIDWPTDMTTIHGNISGDIDADSVSVRVEGETYLGSETVGVVNSDGQFCAQVMKSENADEDVDGDGTTGETHEVRVQVQAGDDFYLTGPFETPSEVNQCDSDEILKEVDVPLTEANREPIDLCTVDVELQLVDGTPVSSGSVQMLDSAIRSETIRSLCSDGSCSYVDGLDESGQATVTAPTLTDFTLFGRATGVNPDVNGSIRRGTRRIRGCPDQPVTLTLDDGLDEILVDVSVSGNQIDWSPAEPMSTLQVSADEEVKWILNGGPTFSPPVTYGTIPPNGRQVIPLNDQQSPDPFEAGDSISVRGDATNENGIPIFYRGETTYEP